jgi:hypothetical protein
MNANPSRVDEMIATGLTPKRSHKYPVKGLANTRTQVTNITPPITCARDQ